MSRIQSWDSSVVGYVNDPKRCLSCRQTQKSERGGSSYESGYGARRELFRATCAECGKNTEVPFEPREGRPVYCRDCFSKVRTNR